TFRLEQNYRSTKSILGAADRLIRNNLDQLKKNLWTENPEGEPIIVVECLDDRDEGHTIVHAIQDETIRNKFNLKDFAVLYRTNAQSRSMEDELRRSGIPYVIVGGIRFYERKEIKDILAYLRLLVNPRDNESFLRIVNYPARGIGGTTLDRVKAFASRNDRSLFDSLVSTPEMEGLTDRVKKGLRGFHELMRKYGRLRNEMSLSELVRSLVDELGILRMFKEEGTAEAMARWENVHELLSAISEFHDTRETGTLEEFLEEVALVSDIDSWEGTTNAVTLMTLHSSKGLEFPVVFIAGLEEGLLPFYSNSIDRPDLEEERRLFYVGITRSQRKLFLSRTRMRYRFGEPGIPSPSRFLSELGSEGIEFVESRSAARGTEPHRRTKHARRREKLSGHEVVERADQHYFGDPLPDYEAESQEILEIKRGSFVRHETFGRGRVIEVNGNGENTKAVVRFDEYGVKNLILKFARLRPA
ncbi:MAG: ATP-binding domain-containing protein, partial [Ignavibacteriales bacterium]|nr:ATP-binding domain-containing protein [Ignavibacteriales bacterium]